VPRGIVAGRMGHFPRHHSWRHCWAIHLRLPSARRRLHCARLDRATALLTTANAPLRSAVQSIPAQEEAAKQARPKTEMDDNEVGKLWRSSYPPKDSIDTAMCSLIRKLVKERRWYYLAAGARDSLAMALRNFGIDPKSWPEQ
jgi:hypothetical protein